MNLKSHPNYSQVIDKAIHSHRRNRSPEDITPDDIGLARLYSYAFRSQTIGTFHATSKAIQDLDPSTALAMAHRSRAIDALADMAEQAMDPVPDDCRAVISTLYRYHRSATRVLDSVQADYKESRNTLLNTILIRFHNTIDAITHGNGIHLAIDTYLPEQASFVVPNLGIIIVPLVYGDYHSWNLAYLAGESRNVPSHLHRHGAEIHLGFNPSHGVTVLGQYRAQVDEGYAMPIPPETPHGWVNTSEVVHHVPFVYGSLKYGGWGIFLDVQQDSRPLEELTLVGRDSEPFGAMVYLERQIRRVESTPFSNRTVAIPYEATNRSGSGGLELSITRANLNGYCWPSSSFRCVSVVRGKGVVTIEGIEKSIECHDHFGIPAGMAASVRQIGHEALVTLDVVIKDSK